MRCARGCGTSPIRHRISRFDHRGRQRGLFRPAPTLGEHNREVLTTLCGLTDAELNRLAAQEVIGTRPKGL
jgi:crotonobetainyl-CoA:carnitine CoA-transferase CaiB-like acyl-CoA transferase